MSFEALFVDPRGSTPRGEFVPALLTLLAVVLFYALLVRGRTAQFSLLVLLFPAVVLHIRRLRDMARSPWLVLVPALLLFVLLLVRLRYLSLGAAPDAALPAAASSFAAAFTLWCCMAPGRALPALHRSATRA